MYSVIFWQNVKLDWQNVTQNTATPISPRPGRKNAILAIFFGGGTGFTRRTTKTSQNRPPWLFMAVLKGWPVPALPSSQNPVPNSIPDTGYTWPLPVQVAPQNPHQSSPRRDFFYARIRAPAQTRIYFTRGFTLPCACVRAKLGLSVHGYAHFFIIKKNIYIILFE